MLLALPGPRLLVDPLRVVDDQRNKLLSAMGGSRQSIWRLRKEA